ncbi:MAG: hypothetical protein ACR2II_01790 [Chthoniobacterales bacterium]
MRLSSAAAKCIDPAPRWRLSASLIALLLLGSGADFAPALAAGMGDSNLSVATSSSSLAGGTAKLIVGTLHREGDKYVGDYRLKVFPYFFKSEKGGLFIRVSEPALRRIRGGLATTFTGQASPEGIAVTHKIAGRATPSGKEGGDLTFTVSTENGALVFHTSYRLVKP